MYFTDSFSTIFCYFPTVLLKKCNEKKNRNILFLYLLKTLNTSVNVPMGGCQ